MRALPTTTIEIDLQVHRELERRRTRFKQSLNDILRQALGIDEREPTLVSPSMAAADAEQMDLTQVDLWRSTGAFGFELQGSRFSEQSLKAFYRRCLIEIAARQEGFLEILSQVTTRARRLVARDPAALYGNTADIASSAAPGDAPVGTMAGSPADPPVGAEPLIEGWWVDMDLSRHQIRSRILIVCNVAGLTIGEDLKLDFS